MKTRIFFAGLIAIAPIISMAATNGDTIGIITTNSGKVYQNCRIFKLDPDGVFFAHSLGSAKVLYNEMPESARQQLGFDPVKAADYAAETVAKQKKIREQQLELRKEVIKAQAFAQEIARQSNGMQQAYSDTGYVPPLSEWVGTVPTLGWSADNFYTGSYANGGYANWSLINDCLPYNSLTKFDPHQNGLTAFCYNLRSKNQCDYHDSTAFHYESCRRLLHNQNSNGIYQPDFRSRDQCGPFSLTAFGYNYRPRFQPIQYGTNRFYAGGGYTNYSVANRSISGGIAGRPAYNNFVRPNGFFAVPALRTATPPLAVSPARSCVIARPVVSHH